MLFSEIYGSYYNTVAEILAEAVRGDLTDRKIYEIIERKAFAESMLNIPGSLKNGEWPLITDSFETPLDYEPQMPLTTLQKRWMKALLNDPRIRLFDVPREGLCDVRPLYEQGAIVYFDQYLDGDPYDDEKYVHNFRLILQALKEKRKLQVKYMSSKNRYHDWQCVPIRLEYSLKDDKFRLIVRGNKGLNIINLARIKKCILLEEYDDEEAVIEEPDRRELVLELRDERNALERAMLHFSHLEKETTRLDKDRYLIKLMYNQADEAELLIRVLSFGPMIKVVSPDSFISQIKERLDMQKRF